MKKAFKIEEAIKKAGEKYEKLRIKSGLTDEKIEILDAVASAKNRFKRSSQNEWYTEGTKDEILKNLTKVLNIEIELNEIKNLLLAKATCKNLEEFQEYENCFLISDVYAGETDISDFDVIRHRYIVTYDESGYIDYVGELDENIVYGGGYCRISEEGFQNEYPEYSFLVK